MSAPQDPLILIDAWCRAHPTCVAWSRSDGLLVDVPTGRSCPLLPATIDAAELRVDTFNEDTYVAIMRSDGVALALARSGVCFAPNTAATGPLDGMPPVVCMADLSRMRAILDDATRAPEGPDRSALDAMMVALAVLDGARGAGFDVSEDERALDQLLAEIERRVGSGAEA